MRMQANLNASPIIQEINKISITLNSLGDNVDHTKLDELLEGISEENLHKLLITTTVSTRKEDRCKHVAEVLYESVLESLSELSALTKTANDLLPLNIQALITKMFADNGGNINWEALVKKIGDYMKNPPQRQPAQQQANGLEL